MRKKLPQELSETTPEQITPEILKACASIVAGAIPYFVPIKPDPKAIPTECFINVRKKIKEEGGEIIHGWAIWEWKHIMIDAEFHSIWKSPQGELACISKRLDEETSILFLPDHTRKYAGFRFDNKRFPLTNDTIIHKYISIVEQLSAIKFAFHTGSSSSVTREEYETLAIEGAKLQSKMRQKYG